MGATTPSFAANLRGGVAVAGNTLETCPANLAARARHKAHHGKTSGSRATNEPCINDYNNAQNMQYVNVDPGDGRFNSSTATVTIPAGATVVKAFLYWAADLSRGVSDPGQPRNTGHDAPGGNTPEGQKPIALGFPTTFNHDYGTVEFRAGAGGSYSSVNAFDQTPDQARWDSIPSWYSQSPDTTPPHGNSPGWAYQVRADVTPQLRQRGRERRPTPRSQGAKPRSRRPLDPDHCR